MAQHKERLQSLRDLIRKNSPCEASPQARNIKLSDLKKEANSPTNKGLSAKLSNTEVFTDLVKKSFRLQVEIVGQLDRVN